MRVSQGRLGGVRVSEGLGGVGVVLEVWVGHLSNMQHIDKGGYVLAVVRRDPPLPVPHLRNGKGLGLGLGFRV